MTPTRNNAPFKYNYRNDTRNEGNGELQQSGQDWNGGANAYSGYGNSSPAYTGHPSGRELPAPLRNAVGEELSAGERLLWTGQPDAAPLARAALPAVFFGIPWTLFSLFWVAMAFRGVSDGTPGLSWLFPLFGVPFVLIGFAMLGSPFWAARTARDTAYAITNRRVLTITMNGKTRKVDQWVPQNASDLERMEKADGTGDLTLLKRMGRDSDGDACVDKKTLSGIPDVRAVERLVRETFFAAPAAASPSAYGYNDAATNALPVVLQENVGANAPWWTRRS